MVEKLIKLDRLRLGKARDGLQHTNIEQYRRDPYQAYLPFKTFCSLTRRQLAVAREVRLARRNCC